MIRFLFLTFFLIPLFSIGQINRASNAEEKLIWKKLKKEVGFKKVFRKYKKYRLEIIYTEINRSMDGTVSLKDFHLGDSASYFYPASMVKLPIAIALMEMIGKEPYYNTNLSMKLRLDTSKTCSHQYDNGLYEYHRAQKNETINDICKRYRITEQDFLFWNGLSKNEILNENISYKVYHRKSRPSLIELIKPMLVYSDNEAYNKLFEMIGGDIVNYWLQDKKFDETNVSRKFSYCVGEEKSFAVAYDLLNDKDVIIYHGEQRKWNPKVKDKKKYLVGKKHFYDGEWVNLPRDFSDHNEVPLSEFHEMLQRVLFPSNFPQEEQFDLSMNNYRQLIRFLGMYPNEDIQPRDTVFDDLPDGQNIFLFNGDDTTVIDNRYRIINMVGQAYGFSIDGMYFTDVKTNTEFMLSCRIYTNKNEILGDDTYEYKEIAMPLMKNLGNYFFNLESNRKKEVIPNFTIMRSLFDQ